MATHDVPGANPVNGDVLAMGCWAEHEDGSLIFVESTEGNRVIYSVFDLSKSPIIEYRDAMSIESFKKTYSWGPGKTLKWTWHDKTPFPWDHVIKSGATDGPRYPSAHDTLTAAEQIAQNLRLRGEEVKEALLKGRPEVIATLDIIGDKIKRAINELLR